MPSFRKYIAFALISLLLSSPLAFANEPPSSSDVESQLSALADSKLPEAELAKLTQTLEKTLSLLRLKEQSEKDLEKLNQQLSAAPRLIGEAQRELTRLKASQPTPVAERYSNSKVSDLEQMLSDRNNQLSEWQKQIIDANSLIITSQTRPERAQAEISSNQARAREIGEALKSGKLAGTPLTNETSEQLNAELAQLNAQTQLRRQELSGNSLLQDLGASQRALLDERIKRLEQELTNLQELVNKKRREMSEMTFAEQSQSAEKLGGDGLLSRESALNVKYSDYLLKATNRLNQITQKNLQTKQQLDTLNQSDQALDQQISVLQGSILLSKILYQQKQALPKLDIDKNLSNDIADIRLYQFEINQQRELISNPATYIDTLIQKQPDEDISPALRNSLQSIIEKRRELLDLVSNELGALLNESITLQLTQKQLQTTATALSETLEEQMFWIPSNKPLNLDWFMSSPAKLKRQLAELPWISTTREFGSGLVGKPLLFLPLLLVIGLLLWRRSAITNKLSDLHKDIGHYKNDNQLHTPMAILLNILLALPGGLFLTLCGFALQIDARGQNASLASAFFSMAQAWMVLYTVYRILSPSGVAELHFRWTRPHVAFLRRYVRYLGLIVLALVAVVTIAGHRPAELADDVLGIAICVTCYALMAWLLSRVLLTGPARENSSMFRTLIASIVCILPLALIVVVGMGYFYTALRLTDRLLDTLGLMMLGLIVEATFVRGLSVAARRLAYQRAMAKRQAAQAAEESETGEVVTEEPTLDIEQVNQQSLRLVRLALLGVFISLLWLIWADLISVFSYLDNVTLYEYVSGTGAMASMVPISLSDVLGALVIIGITIALGRNLPGLLEVLVLSRMKLAQGSSYATTTLLSYAIVAVGTVTTLSTLGVSWDKLQWLVAALSVGLGFGLQEIFANFISGLIILFERPVRIGDVVTIGNLSGTVSKIRIRATTITDFDRKEIIVPNKTFVTDQLINWSLNDTVTRITVMIGLAYESDLELARKLMMQAAMENPRVLRDPEPLLFFLTIGASTFNYELRVHVRELGDRNAATDELLTRIAMSFREHKIEMAFNQLDVVVKNLNGAELNLKTVNPVMVQSSQAPQSQAEETPTQVSLTKPSPPAVDPN
ncbi:mechanosensitive channel MscK [Pseudomonas sp. M30-35]|uniref:mechanosensitive channel MscK n=1 Tax=Pseudomonas sp. M30-35 TaxID=1981174 RepID=UPI000B3CC386|nr:mechanosensitive channel MscK [Pseudomonas sp. M30-35]ARU90075.1 mechanosensitive channel MscK [Pseudomonas sp. M30-35]